MNLKDKSILVVDRGLFLSFALKMSNAYTPDGFGKVLYHYHTRPGRPSINEISVGKGYEGINVINSIWDVVDDVDVIAFPDVLDGSLQAWLRKRGYAVWGSGKGEELELYRYFSKRVIESVGLPMNPYKLITGLPALRDYLQTHDNKFVKVSFLRGLWESRQHETYWISKPRLDWLEYTLGPLAEEVEFIVEDPIKTKLEIGYDGGFITEKSGQGRFMSMGINGVEIKDSGYVGVVQKYSDMASELTKVNEKLRPVLEAYCYRNLFSTELRKDVLIDPCARQGSPSGEAQLAVWRNMPEVVYAGAHGEIVDPEPAAKYVAQAMAFNKGDETEWCPVKIPEKLRPNVRLYFGLRKGKEDWVVPQTNPFDEIGSVVMTGDTAQEAIDACKESVDKLGGDISVKVEALDKAMEEFELMEKRGINITPANV